MEDIRNTVANIFNTAPFKINLHKCNSGDVNSSYIAEFEKKKIFIKIENSDNLPRLYSGQIERELAGMKLCASKGIPCPNVLAHDLTGKTKSNKYLVTEFIDHPLLSRVWNILDVEKKQNIKKQAINIINSLIKITSSQFGDIYEGGSIGRFESWSKAFLGILQIAVYDCERFCTLNQTEIKVILQASKECSFRLPITEIPCLCHMDLHWNNIFVDRIDDMYEIVGIIDFGSSLFAPEYSDFFRLQNGFLYGTEKFYEGIDIPYIINEQQKFATDLLNSIDYYVFLSFTNQNVEVVKKRIIEKCNEYLKKCRL
jgi:aminoglycoside phosphotransferase (APT) family kinase protein